MPVFYLKITWRCVQCSGSDLSPQSSSQKSGTSRCKHVAAAVMSLDCLLSRSYRNKTGLIRLGTRCTRVPPDVKPVQISLRSVGLPLSTADCPSMYILTISCGLVCSGRGFLSSFSNGFRKFIKLKLSYKQRPPLSCLMTTFDTCMNS
jgi:hypothetical protein